MCRQVHRLEATRIILHGQSEFEASDVILVGNYIFEVWTLSISLPASVCSSHYSSQRAAIHGCIEAALQTTQCWQTSSEQAQAHHAQVPDGYRMVVHSGLHGGLRRSLHPLPGRKPSWEWQYGMGTGQRIQLSLKEPAPQTAVMPMTLTPETPFIYVI